MTKSQKPRVFQNCVANKYTASNERIIEFTFPDGTGGLISFWAGEQGRNSVCIYRYDSNIDIQVGNPS